MNDGNYADTQRTKNAAYRKAYQDWVASLSPKERRRLSEQGLLRPEVDAFHLGKGEDVSNMPVAGEDTVAADGDEVGVVATQNDSDRIWEILRRLLGELLSCPNTRLSLECLALVSGAGFMGDSMAKIAKRHGITRAAVSKRCIELTDQLGIMPSRAMRSLTARRSYRTKQNKIYELRECFDHRRRPGAHHRDRPPL